MGYELTVNDLCAALAPRVWRPAPPSWPPDAFALAATLLLRSGAYVKVVSRWPPSSRSSHSWTERIKKLGAQWRRSFINKSAPPAGVRKLWDVIWGRKAAEVRNMASDDELTDAILQLCAAADEASAGAGVPSNKKGADDFDLRAGRLLLPTSGSPSTLCDKIHPSRARVLPKMRTPQHGITLRSLSGNLALVPARDVEPEWWLPAGALAGGISSFNVLLVPWPFEVLPSHFTADEHENSPLKNLPESYGFFRYSRPSDRTGLMRCVESSIEDAEKRVGTVHAIVFPELSLTEAECEAIRPLVGSRILITGIAGHDGGTDRNYCRIELPFSPDRICIEQDKHHRWCLDRSQVLNYGLGGRLSPSKKWWETHVPRPERKFSFFALDEWLTIAVLICEDLARQDPVAEIVRSVGPNLVVALLMDGPQHEARWPGRYASVLADDPGSSVLSFSSLGMVELSRPPGKAKSRVVGLWKDPSSGAVELTLDDGASGIVLCLARTYTKEWMADGRDDGGATGSPLLAGVHPVFGACPSKLRGA